MSVVPSESETTIDPGAKEVEFVPPFATGSVPVTPVVSETCPVRLESDRHVEFTAKHPVEML